jgi:hypothetical protein
MSYETFDTFQGKRKSALPRWHEVYQAALFETDRDKIPQKIDAAESAILSRMKELFGVSTDHVEEDVVLDDALYAIRALRNCVLPDAKVA